MVNLLCGQVHLFGHSVGHAHCCYSPRLCDADHPPATAGIKSEQDDVNYTHFFPPMKHLQRQHL